MFNKTFPSQKHVDRVHILSFFGQILLTSSHTGSYLLHFSVLIYAGRTSYYLDTKHFQILFFHLRKAPHHLKLPTSQQGPSRNNKMRTQTFRVATLTLLLPLSSAHSWVEQLMLIDSTGSFTGNPGYARNNVQRGSPGFSDPQMVHILPTAGQPAIEARDIGAVDTMDIKPTDPMCKKIQQQQVQSAGSPRLSAAPGSMVALRYQENGHVTLPQNQPGKPANRGNVYIYGTTQPKADENFLDVFNKWTADGTGGDKRGILLATQPFDDGQCYQLNSGQISQQRKTQFPHEATQLMGADLWCQNDIRIPTDAPPGKPYTIYWVWDWPTERNGDPNLPKGKAEVYTTCMDIDIQAAHPKRSHKMPRAMAAQNVNSAAVPSYFSQLMASSAPAAAPTAAASAPASPAQTPAVSGTPAAQASPNQPTDIASAASVLQQGIVSELVSLIKGAYTPAAASPQIVTVTVTQSAPAVSPTAASNPLLASNTATTPTAAASSIANVTPALPASSASVPASQVPQMPPSSLDIQPPQGLFSGTATPASAVPTPQSASGAAAAQSSIAFAPTQAAAAAPPSSASAPAQVAARTCSKCKKVKRSRILG